MLQISCKNALYLVFTIVWCCGTHYCSLTQAEVICKEIDHAKLVCGAGSMVCSHYVMLVIGWNLMWLFAYRSVLVINLSTTQPVCVVFVPLKKTLEQSQRIDVNRNNWFLQAPPNHPPSPSIQSPKPSQSPQPAESALLRFRGINVYKLMYWLHCKCLQLCIMNTLLTGSQEIISDPTNLLQYSRSTHLESVASGSGRTPSKSSRFVYSLSKIFAISECDIKWCFGWYHVFSCLYAIPIVLILNTR